MTRGYESPARREQAEQTRSRIIETAVKLLVRDGLATMTIGDLAGAARVSPQTIYNSIGGKAEVVKAAYDVTLAGDEDPTPMSERPAFQAIRAAEDLRSFAASYAHWVTLIYARVGTLLGALISHGAAGDPLLEEFIAKIEAERRIGTTHAITALTDRRLLPPNTDPEQVIDGVWTLTAPENWFRLVQRRRWPQEHYQRWLTAVLLTALEAPAGAGTSRTRRNQHTAH